MPNSCLSVTLPPEPERGGREETSGKTRSEHAPGGTVENDSEPVSGTVPDDRLLRLRGVTLYKRGDVWWAQARGKRISTHCYDVSAATLWAARFELRETILSFLRADSELAAEVQAELDSDKARKRKGFVYAFRIGERVKIGFSTSPRKRFRHVQTHCPETLELVGYARGSRSTETELHARFAAARLSGEWFNAQHPDVAEWLDDMARQFAAYRERTRSNLRRSA